MQHFVYVLQSDLDGKLYIGLSKDVASRIKSHNAGRVQSTKHRRPFYLLGYKPFSSFEEARKVEVHLKHLKNPAKVRAWVLK